jgi:broad specificity phosphatase PhoE
MQLILIRHGRPDWRLPRLVSLAEYQHGLLTYDTAHLSTDGIRAIEVLAPQLPQAPILSSDLIRARETADIIGHDTVCVQFDSAFRELQAPTLRAHWLGGVRLPPALWSLVHWDCWLFGVGEQSETPHAAWRRAKRATDLIRVAFGKADTLILVSHGWFITLLTLYLRKRGLIRHGPLVPDVRHFGGMTEYQFRVT